MRSSDPGRAAPRRVSPTGLAAGVLLAALSACAGGPAPNTATTTAATPSATPAPHLGRPITDAAIAPWNIDIRTRDGLGLPPGAGSVAQGRQVYEEKCASCHGAGATGGPVYGTMVGGIGSFTTERRVLTPGSMYPYAPILFDYIRRAMPMNAPQSLSDNEVYAVSAYLLNLNGLLPAAAVMDRATLPQVMMPNRNGFVLDDRPDTGATRCMSACPVASGKAQPMP